MTSPATQGTCPKCLGYGGSRPVEDGEWVSCSACNGKSQRAELLTQELESAMAKLRTLRDSNDPHLFAKFNSEQAAALLQHIAALTQRAEALKRLVLAVDGSGMCGPVCDDVNGRNWFDARQAALSQEPRDG